MTILVAFIEHGLYTIDHQSLPFPTLACSWLWGFKATSLRWQGLTCIGTYPRNMMLRHLRSFWEWLLRTVAPWMRYVSKIISHLCVPSLLIFFVFSVFQTVSKMLCLHIPALLPAGFAEMEIPVMVQTAAVLGIGLLYQGTAHRLMTEVLLAELSRSPTGDICEDREVSALASVR